MVADWFDDKSRGRVPAIYTGAKRVPEWTGSIFGRWINSICRVVIRTRGWACGDLVLVYPNWSCESFFTYPVHTTHPELSNEYRTTRFNFIVSNRTCCSLLSQAIGMYLSRSDNCRSVASAVVFGQNDLEISVINSWPFLRFKFQQRLLNFSIVLRLQVC